MEVLEFCKTQKRMCDSYPLCLGCPLLGRGCSLKVSNNETENKKIVDTVEKWGKENPARTNACDVAIKAIEKQIPKKPRYIGEGAPMGKWYADGWECPRCGKVYGIGYTRYVYCPNCGQATEMKLSVRVKMLRAMETIAREVNDEDVFEYWLALGIADGDIDGTETDEDLEYYCDDETFADLMETFLDLMVAAKRNGGLYCDGIVSKHEEE